jgi:queuosine biosynthesis protein QueC
MTSSMRAVVLLSGGLDSATTLAIARSEGRECHCLTIDYGQRHRAEVAAAARVALALGAAGHRIVTLDLAQFGGSALTDPAIAVPQAPTPGIPVTYVPARNTIFLSLALAWAEVLGATELYFGANAVDYSGYPDCRPDFIRAFEALAALATSAAALLCEQRLRLSYLRGAGRCVADGNERDQHRHTHHGCEELLHWSLVLVFPVHCTELPAPSDSSYIRLPRCHCPTGCHACLLKGQVRCQGKSPSQPADFAVFRALTPGLLRRHARRSPNGHPAFCPSSDRRSRRDATPGRVPIRRSCHDATARCSR